MAKGGKQPGAGRPKGSISKPRFSDYITEEEVKKLVTKAIEMATAGDSNMLRFCLEQHMGKAIQPVDSEVRGEVIITFDRSFNGTQ
jgi:hypothetical protein